MRKVWRNNATLPSKGVINLVVQERTTPISILKEEALLRRISPNHKKWGTIKASLEKARAGIRGEENLDYHLSFLPQRNYHIFNDLRLIHDDKPFQLDSFVLTPHFGLIIETKNIAGTLTFDKFSQMIRTKEQKEQGFLDPIAQAKRQLFQLQKFLEHYRIKPFPLDYLIAISNPSTILKSTREYVTDKIMHAIHIPDKIMELEQLYPRLSLSPYSIQKLSQLLLKEHTPLNFDILAHYQISEEEILKGVQCPACHALSMIRKKAAWCCPRCQSKSSTAHHQAMHDYFLLIRSTITNQQCREFLLLSSKDIAYRLLASLNLPYSGSGKGRVYISSNRRP